MDNSDSERGLLAGENWGLSLYSRAEFQLVECFL